MEDWREKLGAAFGLDFPQNGETDAAQENPKRADARSQQAGEVVHVMLDKKGRHGKVATLVTDLKCDDDALKDLARELKQLCGVGGSARGGEILIQGDQRDKVMTHLRTMGFKVK